MPLVRATGEGFYGGNLKQAGDVFDVTDSNQASWYKPVDQPKAEAKPKAKPKTADVDPASIL